MSVTAVEGFEAAGITAGIKPAGGPDMSVVATADGAPVAAAGVFTSNKMTAAPVVATRSRLERTAGLAAAVICNSGNANAATGAQGLADAERMCGLTAQALGCSSDHVLVCSTGLIGFELPMDVIAAGIPQVVAARHAGGGSEAAAAMMTTDTVPKEVVVDGGGFTVGGIAKGAAMLEPNMATMLAVLTTDAAAEPEDLRQILQEAVVTSFNQLTVDGAQSTNDTVLLLANGRAGPVPREDLAAATAEACRDLALQMADDAEGSTKTVLLRVTGAASDAEAAKAARDCANCQLVKCSWFGEDPYWGRIASEFGAAGVAFDPERITIAYGDHVVYAEGRPQQPDAEAIGAYMRRRRLHLDVDLGMGDGQAEIVTVDLSHAYIDENSRTS